MKIHIIAVMILAFAVASLQAVPRGKRQAYDEPRLSNEVIPGTIQNVDETPLDEVLITTSITETDEDGSVQTTTKSPALDDAPTSRPGNKKKKQNSGPASDTFSRVIDDIFNIPISVLRAVNTLLSNAFGTKQTVEASATASASSSSSTA